MAPRYRLPLLTELVTVDAYWRLQNGEAVTREHYLEQFPEAGEAIDDGITALPPEAGIGVAGGSLPASARSAAAIAQESHLSESHEPDGFTKAKISTVSITGESTREENVTQNEAGSVVTRDESPADWPRARSGQHERMREFGDYELVEEIARGGMGVVFRATQKSLNRQVALKMILSGHLASDADIQRFYDEATAAARLDHPGIVSVYEINETDGQHYYTMALIDGESLAQRLKRAPMSPREIAEFMRDLCEAVHHAHVHGIIHRDLTPANILVDLEGQPRVTDFGLARNLLAGKSLTSTGKILGTPFYMSPEQAAGKTRLVGQWTDIYGLGAILYLILTGRPPFRGETFVETIQQVINDEPVRPVEIDGSVDRDFEAICLKCLSKSTEARYQTATELHEEFLRWLRGERILARPPAAPSKLRGFLQRHVSHLKGLIALSFVGACLMLIWWSRDVFLETIQQPDEVETRTSDTVLKSLQTDGTSAANPDDATESQVAEDRTAGDDN